MKIIHTDRAPPAIGPYSQAVISEGILYTSGQIALNPATGEMVGGNAREQIIQCLKNLTEILMAAGTDKNAVLKTTLFLTSMDDFVSVNEIYAAWLGQHRPARSTVAVSALPRGALVEIECMAKITG